MKMNWRCFTSILLTAMLGWSVMAEETAPPADAGEAHNILFTELLPIPEAGTEFPPEIFTLKWEVSAGEARGPDRFYPFDSVPDLTVSIHPVYLISLWENTVTLIDPDTKTVARSTILPEEVRTQETLEYPIDLIYLNTPEGGAIAGIHLRNERISENDFSFTWKMFIKPLDDDAPIWRRILEASFIRLFRLPVSEVEDLLVFTMKQRVVFMDYKGNIRLSMPVPEETTRLEIVETPSGGLQLIWADKQTARGYALSLNDTLKADGETIEGGGE